MLGRRWSTEVVFHVPAHHPMLSPKHSALSPISWWVAAIVSPEVYSQWCDAYTSMSRFSIGVPCGQLWIFPSSPFSYIQSFLRIENLHWASLFSIPNSRPLCTVLSPRTWFSRPNILYSQYWHRLPGFEHSRPFFRTLLTLLSCIIFFRRFPVMWTVLPHN